MQENTLTDSLEQRKLDQDKISYMDDEDIVLADGNCWKLIPKERIKEEKAFEDGRYSYREKAPSFDESPGIYPFGRSDREVSDGYTNKARYFFGLKNIRFGNRKYPESSAICSAPIETGEGYVTIDAEVHYGENSSVEFYIIDGTSEIAVMPENESRIVHEKLFYGLPARFSIDTDKPVTIYKNGAEVGSAYDELSYEELEENSYSISYTPLDAVHKYYPVNKTIRIKIITRCFGKNFTPAKVRSVVVRKHEGEQDGTESTISL